MSKTTSALLILSLYVLANLNNGVEAAGRGSIPRTDAEKDHHNDLLYGPQHWFFFSPFFHPFWFGHLPPWFPHNHDNLAGPPLDIPPFKGDGGYGPGPFGGNGPPKGGGKGPIDVPPVKGGDGGYGGKGPIDVPPVKGGDGGYGGDGGKGPIVGPPIKGSDGGYPGDGGDVPIKGPPDGGYPGDGGDVPIKGPPDGGYPGDGGNVPIKGPPYGGYPGDGGDGGYGDYGGYGGKGPIDVPPVKGGGGKGPIDGPPIKGDDVSYYGKSSLTGTEPPKRYKGHGLKGSTPLQGGGR
ncbi:hypothetical protein AAHE18_14G122200 [Arachis hypogaea]